MAEHRLSVLSAMESVSLCPMSSSGQQEVASLAVKTLIVHIKQEGEWVWLWVWFMDVSIVVHGGTAVAAANVLRAWCALLPQESKEIIDFLKVPLNSDLGRLAALSFL